MKEAEVTLQEEIYQYRCLEGLCGCTHQAGMFVCDGGTYQTAGVFICDGGTYQSWPVSL